MSARQDAVMSDDSTVTITVVDRLLAAG